MSDPEHVIKDVQNFRGLEDSQWCKTFAAAIGTVRQLLERLSETIQVMGVTITKQGCQRDIGYMRRRALVRASDYSKGIISAPTGC